MFSPFFRNETWIQPHLWKNLQPTLRPVIIDEFGSEVTLPAFIQFNSQQKIFQVVDSKLTDVGKYKVGLKMGFLETSTVTCTVTLNVIEHPAFVEIIHFEQQTLNCNTPWQLVIPDYKDTAGELMQAAVKLGKAESFLVYNPKTRIITIAEAVSMEEHIGTY